MINMVFVATVKNDGLGLQDVIGSALVCETFTKQNMSNHVFVCALFLGDCIP